MEKYFNKLLMFISLIVALVATCFSSGFFVQNAFADDMDVGFLQNFQHEFYIKAVNPGYTIDGTQNVGEMIEIGRKNTDASISLAGLAIRYTNSSGKEAEIADLSKYIWRTGETLVMRLASAPERELSNYQYTKTLAFKAGPLKLMWNGEEIDSVCWDGSAGCYKAFSSSNPTVLVRDMKTGEFGHVSSYSPEFSMENLEEVETEMGMGGETVENVSKCRGIEFSEILSYYESSQSEQFIEIHNRGVESVVLEGCFVRYKNKNYPLNGQISADGYFVRQLSDFKLTKNPTTSNVLELIDADGTVLDRLEYFNGQRKGTAYAFIGYDSGGEEIWKVTYAPTPGEPNNYQEFKTCESGKVLNEATGNCVKATSLTEKVCAEGQYLNLLTGRCKKYETASTTTCKEGYYLNEETGRCRKIQNNDGTDYALVPETYSESSSFVALWLVIGVVVLGLIYVVYEFRHDIMRIFRKFKAKF